VSKRLQRAAVAAASAACFPIDRSGPREKSVSNCAGIAAQCFNLQDDRVTLTRTAAFPAFTAYKLQQAACDLRSNGMASIGSQ
jgi:hypothetical protein